MQLGLSDDEISCGVNGAVPPTVSFTLSSWLMSILKIHDVPIVLKQSSTRPYHCGVSSVQEVLTSDGFSEKWGGGGDSLNEYSLSNNVNSGFSARSMPLLIFNQDLSLLVEFLPDESCVVPAADMLGWYNLAVKFANSLGLKFTEALQLMHPEDSILCDAAPWIVLVVESTLNQQWPTLLVPFWSWLSPDAVFVSLSLQPIAEEVQTSINYLIEAAKDAALSDEEDRISKEEVRR